MKLHGLWWWIDRWRKSTAYIDMTLEQQGAYRNLLDEAALRGGAIPNNEDTLAKACGDARKWRKIRDTVMARFTLCADGWRNTTMDEVIAESQRRSDKQRAYRNGHGNADGNADGNGHGNSAGNSQRPPDPDPDPILRKNVRTNTSADADFAVFWLAYPISRRVGGKPGRDAFRRAAVGRHGDHLAGVLLALEQQKRSEQWQNPKLIPLMTTWLNQERWLQVLPEQGNGHREQSEWICQHEPHCLGRHACATLVSLGR